MLRQPWVAPGLVKPPKSQRLPDIVTVAEAKRLFAATRVHRNPVLLFPNRHGGLKGAASATTPMDPGGVQTTLHKATGCRLKIDTPG